MKKYLVITFDMFDGAFSHSVISASSADDAILKSLEIDEADWPKIKEQYEGDDVGRACSSDLDTPSLALDLMMLGGGR